jgi:hypothetical protein
VPHSETISYTCSQGSVMNRASENCTRCMQTCWTAVNCQLLASYVHMWYSPVCDADVCDAPLTNAREALAACNPITFPAIHCLLHILVTPPVTTASTERSFSTLRRLKTYVMRNTKYRGTTQRTGFATDSPRPTRRNRGSVG